MSAGILATERPPLALVDESTGRGLWSARLRSPETDVGNANRFVIDHGPGGLGLKYALRHVFGLGWLVWDGRRWRPDDDGAVERAAKHTAKVTVDEAKVLDDGSDEQRRRFAHAFRTQSAPRIEAMIKLARSDERVVVRPDDLDRDPWALNIANGTIDLRTGELHPHDRADLNTKLANVEHDAAAVAPRWTQFLAETFGDDELIAYVRRAVGYTLTGDTREQCAFILHGSGANGKTTFLGALAHVLGDYAAAADTVSFTTAASDRAARSDLARLRGARLVVSDEIERTAYFAETLIKRLTGGDRIVARHLYRDEIEFVPTLKLWFAVNHLPGVSGDDNGIWRRLKVIPCNARPPRPDKRLLAALRREAPGILLWALLGCREWNQYGLGTCPAIDDAASHYRQGQDRVGQFLEECCELDPEARVENGALRDAYTEWERAHGRTALADFLPRLERRGFAAAKSNGRRVRKGLRLTTGTPRDGQSESPPTRAHGQVSEPASLPVPAPAEDGPDASVAGGASSTGGEIGAVHDSASTEAGAS